MYGGELFAAGELFAYLMCTVITTTTAITTTVITTQKLQQQQLQHQQLQQQQQHVRYNNDPNVIHHVLIEMLSTISSKIRNV